MAKVIKTVKEKSHLQSLLSKINKGRSLLQQWIDQDPIYEGKKKSADYEQSIHRHLIDSTDQVSIDGHWCEFGVRELSLIHI